VAPDTIRGSALEFAADVAGRAFERRVCSGEREAGQFQVIETGAEPCIHAGVALRAIRRERGLLMVRSSSIQIIGRMTTNALCGKSGKLSGCHVLMTGITVDYRMCANERKTVLMLVDRLHRNLPSINVVALLAVGAHLAAMDISVAISTTQSHVRKHRTGMARRTRNALVHSAQRIFRFVVIKFRDIANRLPSRKCVTVLAGDVERTVRTMR